MRDYTKLKAFQLADALVVPIYEATRSFPQEERFALASQMRRAVISIASNIVEGCGRHTEAEFLRFLDMASGSSRELEYQVTVAHRLGYLSDDQLSSLHPACVEVSKVLSGLIRSIRS